MKYREKSQLNVETIKWIMNVEYNLINSCQKFYEILINNPCLLKKIHSSEKYLYQK